MYGMLIRIVLIYKKDAIHSRSPKKKARDSGPFHGGRVEISA